MSTALSSWPAEISAAAPRVRGSAGSRRAMFDVTRLLAAYAIVWLHAPRSAALADSTVLGRFAVPFFVCSTVFFVWQGLAEKPDRGWTTYAASRFKRIYLPFLAWSVVYLAFKAVKAIALPDQPNDFPGVEFLWTGSFYHLWFMPFILLVSLGVFTVGRTLVGHPPAELAAGAICVVTGAVLAVLSPPAAATASDLILAWNALPAVFWGIALSVAYHRAASRLFESTASALAGCALLAACLAWLWYFGRGNLAENAAGVACTLVALAAWRTDLLERLGRLGPLAYGIYLSHLLFIKSAEALLNKLGASPTWPADVLVFLSAVIGSTLLAWSLSRFRATRWLVA